MTHYDFYLNKNLFNFDPKTSVVETHISRLRAKVDKPFHTPLLHTIRHLGYSLHAPR